jgi:hypothetical protein
MGCSTVKPSIVVASETLDQGRKRGFDYQAVLVRAERGDEASLAELMRFGLETDAAGALGHGVVLVELLQRIGDSAFGAVVARRSTCVRECLAESLRAGEDYIRPPLACPIREAYPSTWAALQVGN